MKDLLKDLLINDYFLGTIFFICMVLGLGGILGYIDRHPPPPWVWWCFHAYVVLGAIAMASMLVTWLLSEVLESGAYELAKHPLVDALGVVTFFMFIASLLFPLLAFVLWLALSLFQWAAEPQTLTALKIPAVLGATLVASGGLFWFRLKLRLVYGFSEACMGVVVALSRTVSETASLASPTFLLALITASVYLTVRGLDNMHQGATKTPIDPVWKWMRDRQQRRRERRQAGRQAGRQGSMADALATRRRGSRASMSIRLSRAFLELAQWPT